MKPRNVLEVERQVRGVVGLFEDFFEGLPTHNSLLFIYMCHFSPLRVYESSSMGRLRCQPTIARHMYITHPFISQPCTMDSKVPQTRPGACMMVSLFQTLGKYCEHFATQCSNIVSKHFAKRFPKYFSKRFCTKIYTNVAVPTKFLL